MEIVNDYEIAAANLVLALQTESVSTEHREAIKAAVGTDLDLMNDALNALVVTCNDRMYRKTLTADKAKKTVEAEYRAMGFGEILDFRFLKNPVELFYDREALLAGGAEEQMERIRQMWEENRSCPENRVQDGVIVYTLRLLSHLGLITADLDFTRVVMEQVNQMDEERKEKAILPPAIVTEL